MRARVADAKVFYSSPSVTLVNRIHFIVCMNGNEISALQTVGRRFSHIFSRDEIIISQSANEEIDESTIFRPDSIADFNKPCVAYTRSHSFWPEELRFNALMLSCVA